MPIRLSMMIRDGVRDGIEAGVQEALDTGLDAVDIHLAGLNSDPDYLRGLGKLIADSGLEIGYTGGGSFVGPPCVPPDTRAGAYTHQGGPR